MWNTIQSQVHKITNLASFTMADQEKILVEYNTVTGTKLKLPTSELKNISRTYKTCYNKILLHFYHTISKFNIIQEEQQNIRL